MADDQQPPAGRPEGTPDGQQKPMAINILAQYTKDLSFENPNAPRSLQSSHGQPKIDIGVNVAVEKQPQENVYEVVLKLEAKATSGDSEDVAFLVELSYGGILALQNVPQDMLQLVLVVEGPRLLFPFARRVFADAVRDGGFPPLMLDPIDFAQLFMAQQQQRQAQGGAPNGNGDGTPGGSDTPNIILP